MIGTKLGPCEFTARLGERLESEPPAQSESRSVSVRIAQALEEAHNKGNVHRALERRRTRAAAMSRDSRTRGTCSLPEARLTAQPTKVESRSLDHLFSRSQHPEERIDGGGARTELPARLLDMTVRLCRRSRPGGRVARRRAPRRRRRPPPGPHPGRSRHRAGPSDSRMPSRRSWCCQTMGSTSASPGDRLQDPRALLDVGAQERELPLRRALPCLVERRRIGTPIFPTSCTRQPRRIRRMSQLQVPAGIGGGLAAAIAATRTECPRVQADFASTARASAVSAPQFALIELFEEADVSERQSEVIAGAVEQRGPPLALALPDAPSGRDRGPVLSSPLAQRCATRSPPLPRTHPVAGPRSDRAPTQPRDRSSIWPPAA